MIKSFLFVHCNVSESGHDLPGFIIRQRFEVVIGEFGLESINTLRSQQDKNLLNTVNTSTIKRCRRLNYSLHVQMLLNQEKYLFCP